MTIRESWAALSWATTQLMYKRVYMAPRPVIITDSQDEIDKAADKRIAVIGYEHDAVRLSAGFIITDLSAADQEYIKEVHDLSYRIPKEILETDRTLIRQLDPERDIYALFHLYQMPGVTDYVEPLFPFLKEKAYEQDYFDNIYRFYDFGMWNVFLKATGALIGRCGLEYKALPGSDDGAEWLELGYLLSPDMWRQGIGYEITEAVLGLAEAKGHSHFFARIAEENVASVALAKKLGFIRKQRIAKSSEDLWVLII